MSILDAMRDALSGLNAQSDALSNISNNIANSSTVGYKSSGTSFESLVLDGSNSGTAKQAGVTTVDRLNISTSGQISTTGVATDIAINGDGFLVVNSSPNSLSGGYAVTRAGSFRPDANGNLVNSGGYYLQGIPLDANGNPVGNSNANNISNLSTVNISNVNVASSPTTTMTFNANLPSDNTAYASPPPSPNVTTVDYYDPLGQTQTMTFKFTPIIPASAASANTNTWTMDIYDSASVSSTNTTGLVGSSTVTFNATGADAGTMASVNTTAPAAWATGTNYTVGQRIVANGNIYTCATAGTSGGTAPSGTGTASIADGSAAWTYVGQTPTGDSYDPTLGTFTVPTGHGNPLPITIGTLNTTGGMTQLSGSYVATKIQKNGSTFGLLQGVSVNPSGQIVASFSNGASRPIYQLDLAVFPNEDGLTPLSGGAYGMGPNAGAARLFTPGQGLAGTTEGSALEGSNVDIGTELTNLIQTQRAYQSSASVVTTSDQMLQTLNQMKP
ncbi:MAG TPA: flagellar hook-basal body complex protein [Acetobacteraceae bacterium]|nr:flagellar hook-basal body complex protein [Acetobacteraceae bacterium]